MTNLRLAMTEAGNLLRRELPVCGNATGSRSSFGTNNLRWAEMRIQAALLDQSLAGRSLATMSETARVAAETEIAYARQRIDEMGPPADDQRGSD